VVDKDFPTIGIKKSEIFSQIKKAAVVALTLRFYKCDLHLEKGVKNYVCIYIYEEFRCKSL